MVSIKVDDDCMKKIQKKILKKKKTCLIVGWITNTSIKRQDLALKQKVRMRGSETERGGKRERVKI